jgi:hypothetical protein
MMVDSLTVLTFSPQASFQSAGDGAVVLLADTGQLYSSNETTEAFLKLVNGERDLAEIVRLFCSEFDVEKATATSDLKELADILLAEKVLLAHDQRPE